MQSLLGQFYTRIKGSQEDIASEGLTYILSKSRAARVTLQRIIEIECGLVLPDITYVSQNIGLKLERPDISGSDTNGSERIIIEAKFWASLTDNQPVEYLNRLPKESVLLFICPNLRVRPIFGEVLKRLTSAGLEYKSESEGHIISLPNEKSIVIKKWDEILGAVKISLSKENDPTLVSDINQIIGFCNTIDNEAFLPISSDDLSPRIARRINSYCDLIDKVTEELKKRGVADTDGLRATGQKYGYSRFFKIRSFGIGLNVKFESWARDADTPFWLYLSVISENEKEWLRSDQLSQAVFDFGNQHGYTIVPDSNNVGFVALFPLIDKTEDLVVNDMANQIIFIIDKIINKMG